MLAISVITPDTPTPAGPSAPQQPPATAADPAHVAGPSTAPAPVAPEETPASPSPASEDAADAVEQDCEGDAEVLVQERPRKYGRRIVELPDGTDAFSAEASCADGVLTITIPKDGAAEAKKRVPIA